MPLLAAAASAGCTAEQAYGTGQAWQRNQCTRHLDKAELDHCMAAANTSYESYRQQTEEARR
jgi:hypothetical protein